MVQKLNLKKRNPATKSGRKCNNNASTSFAVSGLSNNKPTGDADDGLSYAQLLDWLSASSPAVEVEEEPIIECLDPKKMASIPRESSQRQRFHRETRKAPKIVALTGDAVAPKKVPQALMKNVRRPVHRSQQARLHSLKQSAAGKWKKNLIHELDYFYDDAELEDRLSPISTLPAMPSALQPVEHRISLPDEMNSSNEFDDDLVLLPASLELPEDEDFDLPDTPEVHVTWNPPESAKLRLHGLDVLKTKYPTYQLGNGSPKCLALDLTPYLDADCPLMRHRQNNFPAASKLATFHVSHSGEGYFSVAFHVSWSYAGLALAPTFDNWLLSQQQVDVEALIEEFVNMFTSQVQPNQLDWLNCSPYQLAPTTVSELTNGSHACVILVEEQEAETCAPPAQEESPQGSRIEEFLEATSTGIDDADDLAVVCGACLDVVETAGAYLQLDACRHLLCLHCWRQHLVNCLDDVLQLSGEQRDNSYVQKLAKIDLAFSCPVEGCEEHANRANLLKFFNISVLNPLWKACDFAKKMATQPSDWRFFTCPEKLCSKVYHCSKQVHVQGIECSQYPLVPMCAANLGGFLFAWPSLDPKSPNCMYFKHETHWPASCQQASVYHGVLANLENDAEQPSDVISGHRLFSKILEARNLRTMAIRKNAQTNVKSSIKKKIQLVINALCVAEYCLVSFALAAEEADEDHEVESFAGKMIDLCASLKGQKFAKRFSEIEADLGALVAKITA